MTSAPTSIVKSWLLEGPVLPASMVPARAGPVAVPDRMLPEIAVGSLTAAVAPLAVGLWLRVVDVRTAEAYTVPLALAALVGGVYAHQKKPERSSWVTFGPALALGLGPTLAITLFGEPDPLRALLLGAAALVVTTIGAFAARQSPFVLGALTVGAVAVRMVAPLLPRFTENLPVWVPLAGAGLVLLIVGASYERGRRDMKRLVGVIRRMD